MIHGMPETARLTRARVAAREFFHRNPQATEFRVDRYVFVFHPTRGAVLRSITDVGQSSVESGSSR